MTRRPKPPKCIVVLDCGQPNDPAVRLALERDIAAMLAVRADPIRLDHPALAERVQFRWSLNDAPRNRHERRAAKARSRQR